MGLLGRRIVINGVNMLVQKQDAEMSTLRLPSGQVTKIRTSVLVELIQNERAEVQGRY